jgi:hypothetical protein
LAQQEAATGSQASPTALQVGPPGSAPAATQTDCPGGPAHVPPQQSSSPLQAAPSGAQ